MTDWVEITALIAGPVLAVAYSLDRERRDRAVERKMGILRQLLLSRSSPGDVSFTTAINFVPIEFARADAVLTAFETFSSAANRREATDEHVRALLRAMMIDLGFKARAANRIAVAPYFAIALAEQQRLVREALSSLPIIAQAAAANARGMAELLERSRASGPPPR